MVETRRPPLDGVGNLPATTDYRDLLAEVLVHRLRGDGGRYRDPAAGGTRSNLGDGLLLTFCP